MNMKILAIVMLMIVLAAAYHFKNKKPVVVVPPPPVVKPEIIQEDPVVEKLKPIEAKTYEEAVKFAKENNYTIFLYFGAPWCGYCKQMETKTFTDKDVIEKLSSTFVVLRINTDENKTIARKFGVLGIPAYMIIDSEEQVQIRTIGYKNPTQFLEWLQSHK
jgi:thioredoxin-related protein